MTAPPIAVGEVIAGKYRVERLIGSGGMGFVVAAWHVQLDQLVAVKLLHSETAGSGDATERFRREARAAAKIRSEYVARVIDVGIWTGGVPYIVMEYLEGNDLSAELNDRGPLPVEETIQYLMQAIEALAEAHAGGIVHRDLKPGNLFLATRADGSRLVKVLDFGISKHASNAGEAALTRTSSLIGSPLYMSPEQMRSARSVDARTDVWSLGAIMFELLTGRPPFLGETVIEACTSILNDELPDMIALRPDLDPQVQDIVRRCLEKDRNLRYPSVGDLATDLANVSPASRVHAERALRVLGGITGSRADRPSRISSGVLTPSGAKPGTSTPGFARSGQITPSGVGPAVLGSSSPAVPSAAGGPPGTEAPWTNTDGGTGRQRRWPLVAAALLVLGGAGFAGYRGFSSTGKASETPDLAGAADSPQVAPLSPDSATPEVAPQAPVSPVATDPKPDASAASGDSDAAERPKADAKRPVRPVRPARPPRPAPPTPAPPETAKTDDGLSDFGGRR